MFEVLLERVRGSVAAMNAKLKDQPPAQIIGGTVVAMLALQKIKECLTPNFGDSARDVVGGAALSVPAVRKEFVQTYLKDLRSNAASTQKKWKAFGLPAFTEMPEHGWDVRDLMDLVDYWSAMTNAPLAEHHMSGTIYSRSLKNAKDKSDFDIAAVASKVPRKRSLKTTKDLELLSEDLKKLYTHTFRVSYLWNSLHGNEFGIGNYLTYQVVQMVANMFGARPKEVMGFCTSGGTESLMVAMRCYRNWGVSSKGHKPGEGVIVCADTVHAAVMKAGEAYNVEVVLADTDHAGRMDLDAMKSLLQQYGSRVICIVGSGPSYPTGVVDPIPELAAIAREAGIGLHVDCCLGGFIVNNLAQHDTDYLAIDGVTSLSADTHKNGWAPKGSSAIIMRDVEHIHLGPVNLAYYSIYAIPGWTGGVYGTPRDPGSQQVVATLHAFLSLLAIGKSGYDQLAQSVHATAKEVGELVNKHPELELVSQPEVNVVAWRMAVDWGKGAIYAYAHQMEQHGFTLNAIKGDMVHYCITGRLANDKDALVKFDKACTASVASLAKLAERVKAGEVQFPGSAGMYGTLEAAMEPSAANSKGAGDYLVNWMLGARGAKDAVRAYFMADFNPYAA